MAETMIEAMEQADEELMLRIAFRDLIETKVDVRAPCAPCDGKGIRHGEQCPVCDGDKTVVQTMSLYNLTKKMVPLIIHEMRARIEQESAAASQGRTR